MQPNYTDILNTEGVDQNIIYADGGLQYSVLGIMDESMVNTVFCEHEQHAVRNYYWLDIERVSRDQTACDCIWPDCVTSVCGLT